MLLRVLKCVFIFISLFLLVALTGVAYSENPVTEYAESKSPPDGDYNANYTEDDGRDSPIKPTAKISVCGSGEACVGKCCPVGTYFSFKPVACVNATSEITSWGPPADAKHLTILSGIPNEVEGRICKQVSGDEFNLKKDDGKVINLENGLEYEEQFYCIDNTYDENTSVMSKFAVLCVEIIKKTDFDKWADLFHRTGLVISSICLVIILVLYATSPGKNDLKLQSKCIISSCVNLLIGFLLVIANMTELVTENITEVHCAILGISIQFFLLSFYFWLNVMIYDISRIISGTVKLHRLDSLQKMKTRYGLYALYGWGCPAIISIVTIVMQVESENLPANVIKPNIGNGRCWFQEKGGSIYAYYYGIEVFLHLLNAGLIIYSFYLLKGENILRTLNPRTRNNQDQFAMRNHSLKNHFDMFWQQFCTYILYIFVWIMNSITLIHSRKKFWRFIDILVSLQGLFLLIIVVKFGDNMCRKVWDKVSEAAKSLTSSTSTFDLTEPSNSQIHLSEPPLANQQFHKVSER